MSKFDKIFTLVGCNRLAKELLNRGCTYEALCKVYNNP